MNAPAVRTAPSVRVGAEAAANDNATARPTWVLLAHEGRLRGFRNTLAFRRWCRRAGVPVLRTGRLEVVYPVDVDRAVLGEPAAAAPVDDLVAEARAAAARLCAEGKG